MPIFLVSGLARPAEPWFELLLPTAAASRWLLVVDVACVVALAIRLRPVLVGVPLALGAAFLVVNVLGMATNDFYVGLALFHITLGAVTVVFARRARWLGAALLTLVVALGLLT